MRKTQPAFKKNNVKFKRFFKAIYLGLLFVPALFSQSFDTSALEDTLELKKAIESSSSSEGYKDFSQSNFDNIARQIKEIDEQEELENFRSITRQKQIELAVKLCAIDEKACYLVEQYQNYQFSKKIDDVNDLSVFGLDIFSGYPLSFNQSDSSGVPSRYTLRADDLIEVAIFGALEDLYFQDLKISSEGNIVIKGHGSFQIAGLTRQLAEQKLRDWLSLKINGVESVSINLTRSNPIQIYTLGSVSNPGSYKLSAIASSMNALIASGGVKPYSSLRNINIFRGEKKITSIDLYDFLIDGLILNDMLLMDNDVVQVESMQNSFSIIGEINRPAIYEFKSGETLADAIKFSMGLTTFADTKNIIIKRRSSEGQYETISADINDNILLNSGDEIFVQALKGSQLNFIELLGSIRNIGQYKHEPDLMLGDILDVQSDLLDSTYTGFAVIKRFNERSKTPRVITFNLLNQENIDNISLLSKDKIFIFSHDDISFLNSTIIRKHLKSDLFNPKESQIDVNEIISSSSISILDEGPKPAEKDLYTFQEIACLSDIKSYGASNFLSNALIKTNAASGSSNSKCTNFLSKYPELTPVLLHHAVPVIGSVRKPGLFPFTSAVTAADMIETAGYFVSRNSTEKMIVEVGKYNSPSINLISSDMLSREQGIKFLNVKTKNIHQPGYVTFYGEVEYPGTYPINKGDTILELIDRAGGYTANAYPMGAILSRNSIKEKELEDLQRAEEELKEIFSLAMTSGVVNQSATDLAALIALMTSVSDAKPVGRVVTELDPRVIRKNAQLDIYLENGDEIFVPVRMNTVSIMGSVLNPVTVPYRANFSINQYIAEAGGFKDYGDKSKVYVLKPNGQSFSPKGFSIFSTKDEILPGSTIVIPRKQRPLSGLAFVEYITPVLANLSITAASINSISSN